MAGVEEEVGVAVVEEVAVGVEEVAVGVEEGHNRREFDPR